MRRGRRRCVGVARVGTWMSLACGVSACGDEAGGTAPPTTIVQGVVTRGVDLPVNGASVQVAGTTVVTGTDGRYRIERVAVGPTPIRVSRAGFTPDSATLVVQRGLNTRDFVITRPTVFEFGAYALYVPFPVRDISDRVNAVIVALGGPDTRAFVTGKPFGAPNPVVEAALQVMGDSLRALSAKYGLAILGTSSAALPNTAASDATLLAALDTAAVLTVRPELRSTPIIAYGLSGGGAEATGLVARQRARSLGAFLKAPVALEPWSQADSLKPAFVMLAEQDAFVDNAKITTEVQARRTAGALWAMAVEKGVIHHALSPAQRTLTLTWLRDLLRASFVYTCGFDNIYGAPIPVSPAAGYMGEPATGAVVGWAEVPPTERTRYVWLPAVRSATVWRAIATGSTAPLSPAPEETNCSGF